MNGDFFNRIGVADMEKVHSAVIGWMFSNNCNALTPEQKSELLCGLFGVKPIHKFSIKKVEVEHHNIDLIILTDDGTKKHAWVIENKIKSSQHSNQLDKYVNIIQGEKVQIGRTKKVITDYYKNMTPHYCFLTLVHEQSQCSIAKWENKTYRDFSNLLMKYSLSSTNADAVILHEYLQCITNLADVLDDFLNNHRDYPNVFTDGAMQKDPSKKRHANAKGKHAGFIAENGLETIFQKCFLLHIMKHTQYFHGFSISETHGTALTGKTLDEEKGTELGIQFQNGTFKAQVVIPDLKKKPNFVTNNKNFWIKWNQVFSSNQLQISSGWRRNESKNNNGPYFSYSQKIRGCWYAKDVNKIASEWDYWYNECSIVLNELKKYC